MFLNAIRLKKFVLKLLILVVLYLILFLIDITQEICVKAVDDFLPALKFVPDWCVTSKTIKKLHNTSVTGNDILFFDEDCGNSTFSSDEMSILGVYLNNINLDDADFDENDPKTTIHVRLMV